MKYLSVIIDAIYIFRELVKLAFMVIISPMGIIAGLLLLTSNR